MAGEDLKHRVDWLDGERRKDKALLAKLEERLKTMTATAKEQTKQLKELGARMAKLDARIKPQTLDEMLMKHREDMARALDAMDKRRLELEEEAGKTRALEKSRIEKTISDFRKQIDGLIDLRESMESRKSEMGRQAVLFQEMRKTLDAIQKRDEERTRIIASTEEGRRQDIRRMADIQGEQQAIREKSGENDARLEALESATRRMDGRLTELTGLELERRNAMAIWQEQQTAKAAERERLWKEWEQQSGDSIKRLDEFLAKIDAYHELERTMRQAVEEYRDITERFEIKMKELAEIQRIQEDRLRQDWNTFLADDQKRWTAQNLTWEDEWRDRDRKFTKAADKIGRLEEQLDEMTDSVRTFREGDKARLEMLANAIREWLARSAGK
jgi:DNA repair exonuclease SbcCD ATPase subunit